MRLIDADRLLESKRIGKYYHLPNGDIAIPLIDIEHAPSIDAVPQWIPCNERLPDEREERYWCCSEGGYQFQCRWTNDMYGLGANEYSKWGWHVMDKPQYSRVIAWMPLPKPYEERKEE